MKRCALITATLFALTMLSGCGEKEITGQAFVVTQAKENIKLALVTVGAIPQEEFDQFLKAKQSEKLKQQETLQMKYKEVKNKKIDCVLDIPGNSRPFSVSNFSSYEWNKSTIELLTDNKHKAMRDEAIKNNAMVDEARAKAKAVIAEYEAFDKADFLLAGMPAPKLTSKTDADGKFALKLPSGKYVITANSSREVFGSTETYHWLVTVDASNIKQPLMLSNDNLLETKCGECVKF